MFKVVISKNGTTGTYFFRTRGMADRFVNASVRRGYTAGVIKA